MNFIETEWKLGAETPFSVIHISDTHLTYADERDGERKIRLAKERKASFPGAEDVLNFASGIAREKDVPIIHTGDLIDFVSIANLERAKQFTDENDCYMAAGNHEFSLYLGEAREDAAYRNQSLDIVQAAFKNNIRMSSRVIGGVNFVALDNGYYLFDAEQLEFLKREMQKGFPVVLLLHTPLYEKALYDRVMRIHPCAYLVGVPEEFMRGYPIDRFEQQRADEVTYRTVKYIKEQTQIKAIIAGHLHFNYEGMLTDGVPQIVTGCSDVRLIKIF